MSVRLERIRRLSQYDRGEPCEVCTITTEKGYNIVLDNDDSIVICDVCLDAARGSRTGWYPPEGE